MDKKKKEFLVFTAGDNTPRGDFNQKKGEAV